MEGWGGKKKNEKRERSGAPYDGARYTPRLQRPRDENRCGWGGGGAAKNARRKVGRGTAKKGGAFSGTNDSFARRSFVRRRDAGSDAGEAPDEAVCYEGRSKVIAEISEAFFFFLVVVGVCGECAGVSKRRGGIFEG